MKARATISNADWDVEAICAAAGAADPEKRIMVGETLEVEGVDQAALDAAVAAYDHGAAMLARADARAGDDLEASKALRVLAEALLDQENRLRALEGKPAVSAVQFRQALIGRYKALA